MLLRFLVWCLRVQVMLLSFIALALKQVFHPRYLRLFLTQLLEAISELDALQHAAEVVHTSPVKFTRRHRDQFVKKGGESGYQKVLERSAELELAYACLEQVEPGIAAMDSEGRVQAEKEQLARALGVDVSVFEGEREVGIKRAMAFDIESEIDDLFDNDVDDDDGPELPELVRA